MNEDSTPSARQLVDGVLFLIFYGSCLIKQFG